MTPALQTKKGEVFRSDSPLPSYLQRTFSSLPVPFPSCFPKRSSMMAYGCFCFSVSSRVPTATHTATCLFHILDDFQLQIVAVMYSKGSMYGIFTYIYKKTYKCREICQSRGSSGYVCAFFWALFGSTKLNKFASLTRHHLVYYYYYYYYY